MPRYHRRIPNWVRWWPRFIQHWCSKPRARSAPRPRLPRDNFYRLVFQPLEERESIGNTWMQAALPAIGAGAAFLAWSAASQASDATFQYAPMNPAASDLKPEYLFNQPTPSGAPEIQAPQVPSAGDGTAERIEAESPAGEEQDELPSGVVNEPSESPIESPIAASIIGEIEIPVDHTSDAPPLAGFAGDMRSPAANLGAPAHSPASGASNGPGSSTTSAAPGSSATSPATTTPPSSTGATDSSAVSQTSATSPSTASSSPSPTVTAPLSFEKNEGQTNSSVKYMVQGPSYGLYLTDSSVTFELPETSTQSPSSSTPATSAAPTPPGLPSAPRLPALPNSSSTNTPVMMDTLQMTLVGGAAVTPKAIDQLPGVTNYYIGNNPADWHTGIQNYGEVVYQNVYPGIDLDYRTNSQNQIEFDFTVHPGANPNQICMTFQGATTISLDTHGNLELATVGSQLIMHAPNLYQSNGSGGRTAISGSFVLLGDSSVGYSVGKYDSGKSLVIDPELLYLNFFGGNQSNTQEAENQGNAVAVSPNGDILITGYTTTTNFLTTPGAAQPTLEGWMASFVMCFSPDGQNLIYSTYLGGADSFFNGDPISRVAWQWGTGVAVGPNGTAYVVGSTDALNFPVTADAYQSTISFSIYADTNAFLTTFDASGRLTYSTYLGTDSLIATPSEEYPTIDLLWNVYSCATGVAVGADGTAYVGGYTEYEVAGEAPPGINVLPPTSLPADNSFAIALVPGSSPKWSDWALGGTTTMPDPSDPYFYAFTHRPSARAAGIALSPGGSVYLVGGTNETDFPATSSAYQTSIGYNSSFSLLEDAFVIKLSNDDGSIAAATYLGGTDYDIGYAIAIDQNSNIYVTGGTYSNDFPTLNPIFSPGYLDVYGGAFLTKFNSDLSGLIYSTPLAFGLNQPVPSYFSTGYSVAVDNQDAATVVGGGGYMISLNPQGTAVTYSTFIGGVSANGVAIDRFGDRWVTGWRPLSLTSESDAFLAEYGPSAMPSAPQPFLVQPTGNGQADLNEGSLQLTVGVAVTEGGEVGFSNISQHQFVDGLAENSNTVDSHPIVRFQIPTVNPSATIDYISTSLTWDGENAGYYVFGVGNAVPGDTLTLAIQPPTSIVTTGAYEWQAVTALNYSDGSSYSVTESGQSLVVARNSSPYGAGWWWGGADQLYAYPRGVMWVQSHGQASFYGRDDSGRLVSPAGDFGTLVENGDGSFDYTDAHADDWHFDSDGKLLTLTDRHGLQRSYSYNSDGTVHTLTGIDGGVTLFNYSGGMLQSITDPFGRTTAFGMSGSELGSVVYPDGSSRFFGYDGSGRLTGDHWGTENVTYAYSSTTGLLSSIDSGQGSHYTISPQVIQGLGTVSTNPSATVTDPNGAETYYVMDIYGHELEEQNALGDTQQWIRDGDYQVTEYIDGMGNVTDYEYDGYGDLIVQIDPDGGVTDNTYDPTFHLITSSTDPMGRATTYSYSSQGDLLAKTDALGNVTHFSWLNGLMMSETNALGQTTTYGYDSARRPFTVTDAAGNQTTTTYDGYGSPLTVTDPMGNTTTTIHDIMGRLVETIDPTGGVTTDAYNARGWEIGTTNANGVATVYVRDAHGNVVEQIDAAGTVDQATTYFDYNALDELVAQVDAMNVTTIYDYDLLGRQIEEIDAAGTSAQRTSETEYDANGNVIETINPLGVATLFGYDHMGNVTSEIADYGGPQQQTTTKTYDLDGEMTSETAPDGVTTAWGFDSLGREISQTDGAGTSLAETTTNHYNAIGEETSVVAPNGVITAFGYNNVGDRTSVTDAAGTILAETTRFGFNADHEETSKTDPAGIVDVYGYNADGEQTSQIDGFGTIAARSTGTAYDHMGNVLTGTDANGITTANVYDFLNRPVETIDAYGTSQATETYTSYNLDGNVTSSTDADGVTTVYGYNPLGEETSVTTDFGGPLQATSTTVYDGAGKVVDTVADNGNETLYGYDQLGRQTSATTDYGTSLAETMLTVYNSKGQLWKTIDSNNDVTTDGYDALGRAITEQTPSGGVTTTAYDAENRVVGTIDPMGDHSSTVYNALGEITQTVDGNGRTTTYGYDVDGNQTSITDPDGNTTTSGYDAFGDMIWQTNSLGQTTTYQYDEDGRQVSMTDALGQTITNSYDDNGNKVMEQWYAANGTLQQTLTYAYDANGNMLSASNSAGTDYFAYNADDQLSQSQDVYGVTLNYGYDVDGNRISTQDSLGGNTNYVYNSDDQLISEQFSGQGTQARFDYIYTDRGNVNGVLRYAGIGGTQIVGATAYGYDASDRLTSIVSQDGGGNTIDSRSYSYDLADRLSSETDNGATTNYGYDHNNQLVSAGSTNYNYDANGNPNNSGDSVGGNNQLSSDGTWTYTYDAAGNMVQKSSATTTWQYTYDVGGQLTSAMEFAVDSSGGGGTGGGGVGGTGGGTGGTGGGTLVLQQQINYSYDALGRLASRQVVSYSNNTPTTTEEQNFSFDGQSNGMLLQLNGLSGNIPQMRYLYGDQVSTAPVVSIGGETFVSFGKTWYITDHLGSVVATVGGATAITGGDYSTTTYDAFGNIVSQTGTLPSDFYLGYTGALFDSVTGEQYHNARWYDSSTGRWMSEDPMGFAAGDSNLYRYVGNGPTDGIDPTGETDRPVLVGPGESVGLGEFPRIRTPADSRGTWVEGTKGNGVFEYSNTPENQAAGVVGKRIRFKNGYIDLGAFPAAAYYKGNVTEASVRIKEVKGTDADITAADAEMRIKLKDPNWTRPEGYTWNHAGEPGSTQLELVETQLHKAVAHKGPASLPRASGVVARSVNALTVFLTIKDAMVASAQATGQLKPDYQVIEAPYYFLDPDGSVFIVLKPGSWNVWSNPKKQYVAGPKMGQEEVITNWYVELYTKRAEAAYGRLIEGNWFDDPRFIPGSERKTLPVSKNGIKVGYVDEQGVHMNPLLKGRQLPDS